MPTFYDQLKVSPAATHDEIQRAFQERYGEMLPLVNHHDPQVATQAQQMLRAIEDIRVTLLDPIRRQAYDAGAGIGGATAGLADPQALLQMAGASPTLPGVSSARSATKPPTTLSLWTCPKCSTENQPNTRYCLKCSQELVRECPDCGEMSSLVATGRCGSCGRGYEIASQRAKLKQNLYQSREALQAAQSAHTSNFNQPIGLGIPFGLAGLCFLATFNIWIAVGAWFITALICSPIASHVGRGQLTAEITQQETRIAQLESQIAATEHERG